MTDATIVYVVLAALVVLFVWNRVPVEIVAVSAPLALLATGLISVDEAFAGFGDPTVIFIAALFVVSEGLDATGVTTWAGQRMVAIAGNSPRRLLVVMMAIVALLTALIGVNGAVAALIPMVVLVAVRSGTPPSQMLMPLAFGAHAGSQLALTGSPIHILVSDATVAAGEAGFAYFEFALVGVPLVGGAIAIALLVGRRLIPDREPATFSADLSDHARTLIEHYGLGEQVARMEGPEGPPLVGRPATEVARRPDTLVDRGTGIVEVMIPPRSPIIGEHVFPGETTSSGDFIVLAVQRGGEDLGPDRTGLRAGDTVLLQGTWDALDRFAPADALLVDLPSEVRRQALPMGPGSRRAVAVTVGMVVLLATGLVPPAGAAGLAGGALVLTRVVTVRQAYRSVGWTIVVMVGAMIPLSVAVERSGAAEDIAGGLVDVVGGAGPHALLLGLFVITAIFGQLISNTATALIMIPVAVSAAMDLGISVRTVMMSLTVAAAAAFLTPIATAANLMVMDPAGYRFGDYWKFGLLLLGWFMVASVLLVPVFWPF